MKSTWRKRVFKALLFDMDGTLCDSERYYIEGTYTWLKRYVDVDFASVYNIVGLSMADTYAYLASISGLSEDRVKELNDHYFNVENVINYNDYLFPDAKVNLDILKKNYKLAICTISERYMLDNFIRDCKLEGIFDLLISNNEVSKPKPDPEIYLKALSNLNIKNNEAIVIEDSYNGILSGKKANCLTFARNASCYHVDQSMADFIFDDLSQIFTKL